MKKMAVRSFKAKKALIPRIQGIKALLRKMNQGSGVIGHRLSQLRYLHNVLRSR